MIRYARYLVNSKQQVVYEVYLLRAVDAAMRPTTMLKEIIRAHFYFPAQLV